MSLTTQRALRNELVAAYCAIKLDGQDAHTLSDRLMHDLTQVEIHQALYLPAMAVIRLADSNLDWYDSPAFGLGSEVSVALGQEPGAPPIFKGEITALEIDADAKGMPELTIRCYDRLHRLQRGRQTRSFQQVTDEDLVQTLAEEAGMQAQTIPTGPVHEYAIQNNETNLEFLQGRIHRIGLELVADDKKLVLRQRTMVEAGLELRWRSNLTRFTSRLTASSQVQEVVVRGWDARQKQSVVGTSSSSTNQPQVTAVASKEAVFTRFGAARATAVCYPVSTQQEAEKAAQALHDRLAGRFLQVEGVCTGDPSFKPGDPVRIEGVGQHFSGKYYISACVHNYTRKGYQVRFEANGRQTNSLVELTGQKSATAGFNGLVIGIVTSNRDPENKGRVKVRFPWLGENIESSWARLSSPMAGPGRGFFFLPEIDDEVLIGFEHGDIHRPYVLGQLWNGRDLPPRSSSSVLGTDGRVNQRVIQTRAGHSIIFDDSESEPKISIVDKSGHSRIVIDSNSGQITVEAAQGDISLKALSGKLQLEAGQIAITSLTGPLELKGPQIKLG